MKLALIVNPSAGGGRAGRSLAAVQARLTALGAEHRAELTHSLDHAHELAQQAVTSGRTAVAFGGDGLVGAVAGAVCESDGTLGVLPGGRGNDFARTLGIPQDPVAACDVLHTGTVRALDLGEVNARPYIGIASCGFDSDANRIANEARLVPGRLVYAYGLVRALVSWKPATFTIEFDGQPPRTMTGYSVAAANSKFYGAGMMLAPTASLQDGQLDVVTIADLPRLRFLLLAPRVLRGTHVRLPIVDVVRCSEVRISASRPFAMYADGDPISDLPVTVRARPGAVKTIVPAVS